MKNVIKIIMNFLKIIIIINLKIIWGKASHSNNG